MDGGMIEGDGLYFQGAPVSLRAYPNGGYAFVHWTENGGVVSDQETYEFVAAGNRHLVAHFAAETFQLAYFAAEGGSIDGPDRQWVAFGEDGEPVTAVPDAGHHFTHWSDWAWDGAIRQDLFVMENIEATAHFAPNQYMLIYRAGAGGTVAGTTPQFILHGADAQPVTAEPAAGYRFIAWSDAVATATRHDLALTGDLDVTATFAAIQHTLTYRAGAGGSIDGPALQSVNEGDDGEPVTAVPASGHQFAEWSDGVLTPLRRELAVTADLDVTALFQPNLYELQYDAADGGWLLGPVRQRVAHGSNGVLVVATPKTGYRFSQWSDGMAVAGRQDLELAGPITVTAQFVLKTALYDFPGGTGTESDPYRVASPEDLDAVRLYPYAHFQQVADIDLGQVPWDQDGGWVPIGAPVAGGQFSGGFDGNRHAIRNMSIHRPESDFQGLFGDVSHARIERVTLQNVRVQGNRHVGALLGSARNSLVQNIHIQADVRGVAFIGGLAGDTQDGILQDIKGDIAVTGSRQSGGLVGHASGTHIRRVSTVGSVAGASEAGGILGALTASPSDAGRYTPGLTAPPTPTHPENQDAVAPEGQAMSVRLSDGTRVAVEPQPGAYEVTLASADNDLEPVAAIEAMTALRASGALRSITLGGTGDPGGLRPVLTLPVAEAGTVDLDTILVLRVGPLFVGDERVEDCVTMLPVSVDARGDLRFTDPLLPYAAAVADPVGGEPTRMAATSARYAPLAAEAWVAGAKYVVMTYQNDLNWAREPQLVRMIPDASLAGQGYRRPATPAELTALSRNPIGNIVILVHGHNEEEKEGNDSLSEAEPWLFSYKRRVWDQLYLEFLTDTAGQPPYPRGCTAFYEFIYPTYRPIFSPIFNRSGVRRLTLGESFGNLLRRELEDNPQLAAMRAADMPYNLFVFSHSQGGLVARAGFRHMPPEAKRRLERFVSWGSPHHGAVLYTLRYALQSGHDMVVGGVPLPLSHIDNSWIYGPLLRGALNAKVALDTPGIRDLRWDASLKDMLDIPSVFPSLDAATMAELEPSLFSDNLAAFNRASAQEFEHMRGVPYSLLYGTTPKNAELTPVETADSWWLKRNVQQALRFAQSGSIEQGATLNNLLLPYTFNDGAVPAYSQRAQGVHPFRTVRMADMDHEEFYGSEPPRTEESLAKGAAAARLTLAEAAMRDRNRRCPDLVAGIRRRDGAATVTGFLRWPIYSFDYDGDGQPGRRIARVEARAGGRAGPVVAGLSFSHQADGDFEGQGALGDVPENPLTIVAVMRDGSEVFSAAHAVMIQEDDTVEVSLAPGVAEYTHTFTAIPHIDGVYTIGDEEYIVDWSFGDGHYSWSLREAGDFDVVAHTFTGLESNTTFRVVVTLLSMNYDILAQDEVHVHVTLAPSVTIQGTDPVWLLLPEGNTEATHVFEAVARPVGAYRFDWDFGDGTQISETPGPGERSSIAYTYTALEGGETFTVSVALRPAEGGEDLADDQVVATVTDETPPDPSMVLIPGGTNAGTNPLGEGEEYNEEYPEWWWLWYSDTYSLTVSSFYMDKYEVTKALWDEVYAWAISTGYSFDNSGTGKSPNHPVHNVNWYDVVKWCNARSQKEGRPAVYTVGGAVYKTGQHDNVVQTSAAGYRLPRDAEWEYAARGGLASRRFPWGDTIQHARANYQSDSYFSYDTSPTRGYHPTYSMSGYPYTSPVGSFAENGYGLHDMTGNVWEWCFDWHPEYPDWQRVLRGGSWHKIAAGCRVGYYGGWPPNYDHGDDVGFRAVLPIVSTDEP